MCLGEPFHLVIFLFLQLSIIIYATTKPYPIVERYKEEETFRDPVTKKRLKFPNINGHHEVCLSVVVPAYNEEERCKFPTEAITIIDYWYRCNN